MGGVFKIGDVVDLVVFLVFFATALPRTRLYCIGLDWTGLHLGGSRGHGPASHLDAECKGPVD